MKKISKLVGWGLLLLFINGCGHVVYSSKIATITSQPEPNISPTTMAQLTASPRSSSNTTLIAMPSGIPTSSATSTSTPKTTATNDAKVGLDQSHTPVMTTTSFLSRE